MKGEKTNGGGVRTHTPYPHVAQQGGAVPSPPLEKSKSKIKIKIKSKNKKEWGEP